MTKTYGEFLTFEFTGIGCETTQVSNSYPALVIPSYKILIVEKDKHYNLITSSGEQLIPSYVLDSVYMKSNTETGENLGQIEDIKEISMAHFSKTEEEHNKHGDINWFNYKNEEYTMSVDFDKEIDASELHKILGIDTSNMPDAYDVQFIKFVQSRKHKKKRINKKWLKRYGYKQISVESKGWKVKTDTDGNVEFIK